PRGGKNPQCSRRSSSARRPPRIRAAEARNPREIEDAFAAFAKERACRRSWWRATPVSSGSVCALPDSRSPNLLRRCLRALPALQRATSTIPIVMAYSTDPVGNGLVASLVHPGGNITGLAGSSDDSSPKQLDDRYERKADLPSCWRQLTRTFPELDF